jgi:hypothetical protein
LSSQGGHGRGNENATTATAGAEVRSPSTLDVIPSIHPARFHPVRAATALASASILESRLIRPRLSGLATEFSSKERTDSNSWAIPRSSRAGKLSGTHTDSADSALPISCPCASECPFVPSLTMFAMLAFGCASRLALQSNPSQPAWCCVDTVLPGTGTDTSTVCVDDVRVSG